MGIKIMDFRPADSAAWTSDAACATADGPAPMYPHETDVAGIEYAKSLCRACPVSDLCLREALDRNEPYGVWGGMTAAERITSRRSNARRNRGREQTKAALKVLASLKPVSDVDTSALDGVL